VPGLVHSSGRARGAGLSARATLIADQIRRAEDLLKRLAQASGDEAYEEYSAWHDDTERLLRFLLRSEDPAERDRRSVRGPSPVRGQAAELLENLRRGMGELRSVTRRLGLSDGPGGSHPAATGLVEVPRDAKVWVIHGRNGEMKEKVARFLMKLGLEPVILDEQAARGRTLIEKLEAQTPLAFAVVLLTGDDIGALAAEPSRLRPRARQNVIFELGFSIAKLGRACVCVLYEEGVELPSDFRGVEYKPLDTAGAWRRQLARELLEAGLPFDPLRAL